MSLGDTEGLTPGRGKVTVIRLDGRINVVRPGLHFRIWRFVGFLAAVCRL